MKNNYSVLLNKHLSLIILSLFAVFRLNAQITQTFLYTGNVQTFVVPACVSSITIDVKGAQGGASSMSVSGGLGGSANGVLSVSQGNILNIYVGSVNGYNGGGAPGLSSCTLAMGGYGGGASDVRLNGTALANRVIVGAGGGGAGGDRVSGCGRGTGGGGGGGYYGGGGGAGWGNATVPTGGTQTAGGAAGLSGTSGYNGNPGVLGFGGAGGTEISSSQAGPNTALGGGVGGGLIGANGLWVTNFTGQGGAGGSSYLGTLTNTSTTSGNRAGDGIVTLTYFFSGVLTSVVASPTAICAGSSTTLSAAGQVSYTWNPGGSNASSITVSPTANSTYTIQGTNSLGCISTAVVAVAVNSVIPTLSVASTASAVCAGKTVTFTASGATTYTWTNGIINALSYTPSGTSIYTVTGENACGINTATTSITVNATPTITASVNNPTVCSGNTIILNGGGGTSYSWSGGVTNNLAFSPANTSNYTVTGLSANGCSATAVTGVTVLVTPTITPVVTPTAICAGATATLSAVGATGYTWSPGSNLTAATVTVSPPAPTTYTVFRTNGACSSSSTVNLVVNPLPLVNASASPSQICAGTGINLLVFGAITYTWLPGGFTISNFTVFPNFSTNYTVTGSNGNCTTSVLVPVLVNPTPTITISTSTLTICQGNNVTLTGNGALTYTWLPMNTNNTVENVSPSATTLYTLSGTNASSCTASVNQVIVVNPVPNMNITSSLPFVCANQTAVLSITNPSSMVVYNWSTGATGTSIQANPPVTTNYFATGVNTITGCQNTNTTTLAVYISTFAVTSPTAICKGETATLTASGPATSYSWTANGGVISPSVAVSPVITTLYYVTGSNVSCNNTQSVSLIVHPIPNVVANVAKSQICRFEVSTISANGATSYSWNTGATTPTISFNLSITTTYTLTGTDLNGCSKTTTVTQFVATCIGVEEQQSNANLNLNVYPNPNNGNFSISSDADVTLSILNTLGQTISTMKLTRDINKEITVSNLAEGIYFITGEAGGKKVNRKIVVEK